MGVVLLAGLTAAAAIYTYYGAALVIGQFPPCLLREALRKQGRQLAQVVVAGVICCVSALPLAIQWLPNQIGRGPTSQAFRLLVGSPVDELTQFVEQTWSLLSFQVIGYQPAGWPWPTRTQHTRLWLPSMSSRSSPT